MMATTIEKLASLDKWRQLNQLQEECGEVIAAVNRLRRNKKEAYNALCEEIADLRIMVSQMEYILDKKMIEKYYAEKISRIEERLTNGKL